MVMSRLAKRQMETMTPEERKARAIKAVSARKWRPVKKEQDGKNEKLDE